jgi:hypothetical protein
MLMISLAGLLSGLALGARFSIWALLITAIATVSVMPWLLWLSGQPFSHALVTVFLTIAGLQSGYLAGAGGKQFLRTRKVRPSHPRPICGPTV